MGPKTTTRARRLRLRQLRPHCRDMQFRILYCGPCGYHRRAEELADELTNRFGAAVAIEEGGFGQFDVFLDGSLVASKGGRIKRMLIHGAPPHDQLVAAIERAVADRHGDACEIPPADQVRRTTPNR